MNVFILVGLCFLPLIIALVFFKIFVKNFKSIYMFQSVIIGFVVLIPIVVVQFLLKKIPFFSQNTFIALLATTLIYNGLIEESIKTGALFLLRPQKQEFSIFFIIALLSGSTIGTIETVLYLIGGQTNILLRLFTAMLLHTLCSGLSGAFVWTFFRRKKLWASFFLSIIIHGIYNFFASFNGAIWAFSIVTLFFALIQCRVYYTKTKELYS